MIDTHFFRRVPTHCRVPARPDPPPHVFSVPLAALPTGGWRVPPKKICMVCCIHAAQTGHTLEICLASGEAEGGLSEPETDAELEIGPGVHGNVEEGHKKQDQQVKGQTREQLE